MIELYVFAAMTGLFYLGTALKSRFAFSLCAICLAVSSTWTILLVARELGWFSNDVLLALLLGESVVGGYYLLDRNVREQLLVFRLPVLLTLSLVAYSAATKAIPWPVIVLLAALWLVHGGLYYYRAVPAVKDKVDRLVACCSRW